jgi:hypothetical protein
MEHDTTILSIPHSAVLQYGVPHSTVLQYGDNSPFCSPAVWGIAKITPDSKRGFIPILQRDKVGNYPHSALPHFAGETEGQQKEISPICIPQFAYSMGKLPHSESF